MPITPRTRNIIIGSTVFLLLATGGIFFFTWSNNYRDRIYPGVKIGSLDLGGKTLEEAKDLIGAQAGRIEAEGLNFVYGQKSVKLSAAIVSFDSDLSYPALSFYAADTADIAYGTEAERGFWHYLSHCLLPSDSKNISALYSLNENRVRSFLAESYPDLNISPANAHFSLEDGVLTSNQEKIGKEINYEEAIDAIKTALNRLENPIITIRTQSKYPEVREGDLSQLKAVAQTIIGRGDFTLRSPLTDESKKKTWIISPEQLINWVGVKAGSGKLSLVLDEEKIKEYLRESVAPAIDQDVVLPRFEIKDQKVTSWQTGANGLRLNLEASAALLNTEFSAGKQEITLVTEEISAERLTSDNDFKIQEIIGTGHSRFAGSPVNRRKNIRVGADSLHGLLIKPGEEFSLLKALGTIDGSTGYLTELVIKGDKTVPEYGGGLCQIGTTVFRTALATGLPITQRRNHSYRVSYYEPAGTDATIYDPAPDFRFLNDTGNYILIQSRIAGDDLYFDFWGVKDGRIASTTAPTIYNIVKPEPTKIIETTELAPGEKKCTESSHNGADAYFDYTVTYPEGSTTTPVQTRRFNSHYVPWQAVCLVGVASTTPIVSGEAPIENTAPATGNDQ